MAENEDLRKKVRKYRKERGYTSWQQFVTDVYHANPTYGSFSIATFSMWLNGRTAGSIRLVDAIVGYFDRLDEPPPVNPLDALQKRVLDLRKKNHWVSWFYLVCRLEELHWSYKFLTAGDVDKWMSGSDKYDKLLIPALESYFERIDGIVEAESDGYDTEPSSSDSPTTLSLKRKEAETRCARARVDKKQKLSDAKKELEGKIAAIEKRAKDEIYLARECYISSLEELCVADDSS